LVFHCHAEIDSIQKRQVEEKQEKKRRKRPVVGDLNPLLNALPELSPLEQLAQDLAAQHGTSVATEVQALKKAQEEKPKGPERTKAPKRLKARVKKQ
jgi:hypothetical protein